jgi:hypothetical protein
MTLLSCNRERAIESWLGIDWAKVFLINEMARERLLLTVD